MGFTVKQLADEIRKEKFDKKQLEVRVALPNGESVGISSVCLDEAGKKVWLNADTLEELKKENNYV